ncbi:MAG TPA: hydrogenase maturation protease [Acidimicrobiales bacterium]|nr:hydrogenase maturation protease [Acidimicrobiales bacterium]
MTPHPASGVATCTDAVVAGIGSRYRHDDGVGEVVGELAARLFGVRDVGPISDPLELLGRWDGAELAVVVDAVRSGSEPGTVRVADLTGTVLDELSQAANPCRGGPPVHHAPRGPGTTSSHGIDVLGVLRLARAIGSAPTRVVLVGVEGADFSRGEGLTARVAAAVPLAVDQVRRLVQEVREACPCA